MNHQHISVHGDRRPRINHLTPPHAVKSQCHAPERREREAGEFFPDCREQVPVSLKLYSEFVLENDYNPKQEDSPPRIPRRRPATLWLYVGWNKCATVRPLPQLVGSEIYQGKHVPRLYQLHRILPKTGTAPIFTQKWGSCPLLFESRTDKVSSGDIHQFRPTSPPSLGVSRQHPSIPRDDLLALGAETGAGGRDHEDAASWLMMSARPVASSPSLSGKRSAPG